MAIPLSTLRAKLRSLQSKTIRRSNYKKINLKWSSRSYLSKWTSAANKMCVSSSFARRTRSVKLFLTWQNLTTTSLKTRKICSWQLLKQYKKLKTLMNLFVQIHWVWTQAISASIQVIYLSNFKMLIWQISLKMLILSAHPSSILHPLILTQLTQKWQLSKLIIKLFSYF